MLAPKEVTAAPARTKIIVDVDTGVDDPGPYITRSHRLSLSFWGSTAVFGNADLETITRNTLIITELLGSNVPVYPGADRPLIRPWTGPPMPVITCGP